MISISLAGNDAGYIRLYIGQAVDVGQRIKEHIHVCNSNMSPGLHYSVLRKPGRCANFVLLGKLRIQGCKESLNMALNIGEMLWALVFQSLPTQALEKYLPKSPSVDDIEIGFQVTNEEHTPVKDNPLFLDRTSIVRCSTINMILNFIIIFQLASTPQQQQQCLHL